MEKPKTKICSSCRLELPLSEFYLLKGKPRCYCKTCFSLQANRRSRELREIRERAEREERRKQAKEEAARLREEKLLAMTVPLSEKAFANYALLQGLPSKGRTWEAIVSSEEYERLKASGELWSGPYYPNPYENSTVNYVRNQQERERQP